MLRSVLSFVFDYILVVYFFWKAAQFRKNKPGIIAGCFCLALTAFLYIPGSENIIPGNISRFLIRAVIYVLFLYLSKEIELGRAVYFSLFGAVVCVTCQNIFLTPQWINLFQAPLSTNVRPVKTEIASTLVMYLITAVIYIIIVRLAELHETKEVSTLQYIAQLAAAACSVYVKVTLINMSKSTDEVQMEFSVFSIMLELFLLVFIVMIEQYIHSETRMDTIEKQKIANRYLLKHLEDRKENDERARQIRHDWKNHMVVIKSMADKKNVTEISDYIETLMDELVGRGIHVETGNFLLDGLLVIKLNEAQRKEVDVNLLADFRDIDFISETDLCTIVGNALDNAIEAAHHSKNKQNKYIQIRTARMAGCLIIKISNGYEGKLRRRGDELLTTKKNQRLHGYGIGNINRTLERYDGFMDINTEEKNLFVLTMTIPIPVSEPTPEGQIS